MDIKPFLNNCFLRYEHCMNFVRIFRVVILFPLIFLISCEQQEHVIKIGIVHSLTGTMASSEKPMVDALLLAVDEINNNGGVLGKKIKPIVVDGQSNPAVFNTEVERLINKEKVAAIFACWTSQCRKAIKPTVEKYNNLLFYSVQFEGLETSKNIIYLGSAPNQQIIPGLNWMLKNVGSPLYLVGSDYIFPRAANRIIRNMVYMKGKMLVGERYVPLGGTDMSQIISDIKKNKPAGIINTINGDSNGAFLKALESNHLTHIPVMSFSLGDKSMDLIKTNAIANQYVTVNYLESLNSDQNKKFVKAFKAKYGNDKQIGGAIVSAYSAVKLWAKVANKIKSIDPSYVRKALSNVSMNSPLGIISVDPKLGYIWQTVYVAKVNKNRLIQSVWSSNKPIRPKPFPMAHTQEAWLRALKRIQDGLQSE